MKKILLGGFIIGILFTTAAWTEGADGIIRGRIINGTDPSKMVPDQAVILYRVKGKKALPQITTQTDSQGNYTFKGLPPDPDYKYQVFTKYLEAPYFTNLITFETIQGNVYPVDLPVYELTDKGGLIRIKREHLVVDAADNELSVSQIVIVENTGNKTFRVNNKASALRFPLPNGFRDFRGFGEILKDPDNPYHSSYLYTEPISPGIKEIFFVYKLDFSGLRQSLTKMFLYPTPELDLLLADRGLQLNSPGLTFQGYQNMGQKRFLVWQGKDFNPGTMLNIEITGAQPASYIIYKGIAYGSVILFILMGFGYPLVEIRFFGSNRGLRNSSKIKEKIKNLHKEKMRLLHLTVDLDEKFNARQIPEDQYRRLREKNKQALIAVTRKLNEAKSVGVTS